MVVCSQRIFVASDVLCHKGEIIYVKAPPGEEPRQTRKRRYNYEDCYVAEVLECRALDNEHVYVRVFWLYRPEDLPGGRRDYHADGELIPSNDMQIINAETVHGKPECFEEMDEGDFKSVSCGYKDLFWRQTYNHQTGAFSKLRHICVCQEPANPDYGPLLCSNESCGQWMHPECIERDVVEAVYRREILKEDVTAKQHETMNGEDAILEKGNPAKRTWAGSLIQLIGKGPKKTTPTQPKANKSPSNNPSPSYFADAAKASSPAPTPALTFHRKFKKKVKGGKSHKHSGEVAAEAESLFRAKLLPLEKDSPPVALQTVRVRTSKKQAHEPQKYVEVARCLFCRELLRKQPAHARLDLGYSCQEADGEDQDGTREVEKGEGGDEHVNGDDKGGENGDGFNDDNDDRWNDDGDGDNENDKKKDESNEDGDNKQEDNEDANEHDDEGEE